MIRSAICVLLVACLSGCYGTAPDGRGNAYIVNRLTGDVVFCAGAQCFPAATNDRRRPVYPNP
jgi:hypothetical protein